jgi:hemerythrin-like metal-binding protein
MEWSEDFESGLPEIDGYHRHVFALIRRVREGVDRSVVQEVLADVERLSRDLFNFEEQVMADYVYPGMERHATEHVSLLREIQGYRNSTAYSPRRLNLVLRNWLQSHTMMEDRQLAQHVLQLRTGQLRTSDDSLAKEPSPQSEIRDKTNNEAKRASGE